MGCLTATKIPFFYYARKTLAFTDSHYFNDFSGIENVRPDFLSDLQLVGVFSRKLPKDLTRSNSGFFVLTKNWLGQTAFLSGAISELYPRIGHFLNNLARSSLNNGHTQRVTRFVEHLKHPEFFPYQTFNHKKLLDENVRVSITP
jgi:hypothetical protein